MWITLNDSFLSIVAPLGGDLGKLLVRARIQGDIEKVFPYARPTATPKADYAWRVTLTRTQVEDAMVTEVKRIDYPNFKNSVIEDDRHQAYLVCWLAMADFQASRSTVKKRRVKNGQLHSRKTSAA